MEPPSPEAASSSEETKKMRQTLLDLRSAIVDAMGELDGP
jgi:hypothetical protein